ncbi:hypothetical protein L198_07929, partial [Cryptococcus wingfieldii CBS 7118]
PHEPSTYPCAPSDIRESFPSFLSKLNISASSTPSTLASKQDTAFKPVDFVNFWEAPRYL